MLSADLARKNMIDGQIKPNKVTDAALLQAISIVPRERFVPRHLQSLAYVDEDIALGNGRYLPEPMVIARLIQEARIERDDLVLDIGCGTGYSTALIGHLAATVVGIESDRALADEADKLLHDLEVLNAVVVHQHDLRHGYAQQGPYQVIVINGSIPEVPADILGQLANGGRLVTVLSKKGNMGQAVIVRRHVDNFVTQNLFDAATPTLSGFEKPAGFEF